MTKLDEIKLLAKLRSALDWRTDLSLSVNEVQTLGQMLARGTKIDSWPERHDISKPIEHPVKRVVGDLSKEQIKAFKKASREVVRTVHIADDLKVKKR